MRLKHVVFVLLALYCNAEAATSDEQFSVIPALICRGLWIVPVTFDNNPNQTLHLILDAGADFTSVDPDAIERVTGRFLLSKQAAKLFRSSSTTARPVG